MAVSLDSTLREVIEQFVVCDADHDLSAATAMTDLQTIKILWDDTSRVRLDISVMSASVGALAMIVPAYLETPGGDNINNPAPAAKLTALNPSTIAKGGTGFTLTITGTGFVGGSRILFGSATGTAVFVDENTLTMDIGPEGYAEAGTVQVSVESPGGVASNALPFIIT